MDIEAEDLWAECRAHLRSQVSEAVWLTSLRDLKPLRLEGSELVLGVTSALLKERIESRYMDLIAEALSVVERPGQPPLKARIEISGEAPEPQLLPEPTQSGNLPADLADATSTDSWNDDSPPLAPLIDGLHPRYTFDDFVTGASNRFAHAAALAVAETPARSYNPLFIYGDAGLGKTHLLHAIAHYVNQNYRNYSVRYVSTESFMNDFVEAIRTSATATFKKRYRDNDILLVDDIQFMEGKEGLQEEFFHTFNSLHGAGRQIVISSDRPPRSIATLEDRLRSRFEWGLITDIQPPDVETRLAILRKKSELDQTPVADEVLEFIATNIRDNIRELEGALIRVSAYASLTSEPLTVELARKVLGDIVAESEPKPITVSTILDATEKMFGYSVDELKGKQRHRALVTARQISMYVTRELTDLSYPQIAKEFGGRDHTTVMYAFDKVSAQMGERRQLFDQVNALIQEIKAS